MPFTEHHLDQCYTQRDYLGLICSDESGQTRLKVLSRKDLSLVSQSAYRRQHEASWECVSLGDEGGLLAILSERVKGCCQSIVHTMYKFHNGMREVASPERLPESPYWVIKTASKFRKGNETYLCFRGQGTDVRFNFKVVNAHT